MILKIAILYTMGSLASVLVLEKGLMRGGRWNPWSMMAIVVAWPLLWGMAAWEWWKER